MNMTLGASNVSFGMPDRHTIGAAFLPMAMPAGLTSAIMDARTPQIVDAVKAADLLLGHDDWGAAWIAAHRAQAGRRPGGEAPHVTSPQGAQLDAPGGDGVADRRPGPGVDLGHRAGEHRPARYRVPHGRHRVRRRQLERHRHRLHLRRPRHLQEVQGQGGRRGRRRPTPLDVRAFTPEELRRRLAAGLPGPGHRRPTSRCRRWSPGPRRPPSGSGGR